MELELRREHLQTVARITFSNFIIVPAISLSLAADTLGTNRCISYGETLVSSDLTFKLGFFTPGNSSMSYLGMWYKVSPETVVWVANRNNPLADRDGVLTFNNVGNLVVLNESNAVVWSSKSSRILRNPVAHLLNSGNLVLWDNSGSSTHEAYSWQSFDYLSDTLLVGMKLGLNFRTGLEHHLTSWTSTDDPSRGDFTYTYKIDGLPQIEVVSKGSVKVYRTGPWNGVAFSGASMEANSVVNPVIVNNSTDAYLTIKTLKEDITAKVVISRDGIIECHLLKSGSTEWDLIYSFPHDPCDSYGQCGSNGVCRVNQRPRCLCLQGFKPKSRDEWDMLNSTEGCIRKIPFVATAF
ncbi:G-type lectin S-receptor-like serine/threonine-protein kinase At4g27290 [Syzygium oleosum]|uniref:G-type lectin S-receptor-like serine/threonine-protein kinase At4g27290 n=1 Tax=Syzygium oleosum TaxID=219896 RepID=UPI0024B905A0|nr:G-type lectin S-receptor-like serine/threonine-protein kinase At4g27290 [Syzygium oleosum]